MIRIALPGSQRQTTQLGFGCAYLTPDNRHVLETAYDAGIRHFDVARSYGRGLTEGMLGRFLSRHEGELTVTSKYGIKPPFSHPIHGAARAILKPILKRLRRAARVDARLNNLSALNTQKAAFSGAEARASLALSLRNLRLQRLDLFLMHEAQPADLADESLLDALHEAQRAGRIGAFGVGGPAKNVAELGRARPQYCDVLQYEWTAAQPIPATPGGLSIVYRIFGDSMRRIHDGLSSDPDRRRSWSDEIGRDLAIPGMLPQLLLNAAVALRPDAIVLFSTTQPKHVIANVQFATDISQRASALRLVDLLRATNASSSVRV
jgi:D-threo-aldose 1-dehydrogenase